MDYRQQILVVARTARLADRLMGWLAEPGRDTTLATSFQEAREHLEAPPDLLIAEVKLGEYNGLHLALKADAAGIPAIVLGPPDPVLEQDAVAVHAVYLRIPVTRASLLTAAGRLLSKSDPTALERPSRFRLPVTTVAAEAESLWRAFSESSSSELYLMGRAMLPN